jgi:hypothetical protein
MNVAISAHLIERADDFLDQEQQREKTRNMGKQLFEHFGADKEGRVSTQVRNLQQIVVSATRFADIEDFIKNQMGRHTAVASQWRAIGDDLLSHLEVLRNKAGELTQDEPQRRLIRLHLARGWINAVVSAYLYEKAQIEMSANA